MASLDVKTAFDVAKPSVVSQILSLIGTHGHAVAALLAETEFRCSKCTRQGRVEAPSTLARSCVLLEVRLTEKCQQCTMECLLQVSRSRGWIKRSITRTS